MSVIRRIENKILNYFTDNIYIIGMVFILIISILVRMKGLDFVSGDFESYLSPWFEELKALGGIKALQYPVGDYYIPYVLILSLLTYLPFPFIYMVKTVSIIFEFICAFSAFKLSSELTKDLKHCRFISLIVFTLTVLSPIVIFNGAFWAQCDYIYATFMILSILYMIRERYTLSFLLLGVAFLFKLQTVFIFPVYILAYIINRRFSILQMLIVPAAYIIGGLPAILMGRSAVEVYSVYVSQTRSFGQLSMNVPNIWRFFPKEEYAVFADMGIYAVMLFCILLAVYFVCRGYRLDSQTFLLSACCMEGACILFLPGMHERYVVMYCLLSMIYFMVYDRKRLWVAVIINFIPMCNYSYYLFDLEILEYYKIFAIINLSVFYYLVQYLVKVLKEKDKNERTGISI